MEFAIISDAENQYTGEFDHVVILENARHSCMDKLSLLKLCPFDENVFIDADCLAYGDLNEYWDYFENADDFTCFGKTYPLDETQKTGWFKPGDVAEYNDLIHFIPILHTGVCFIRKGGQNHELYDLCTRIAQNYGNYKFATFQHQTADEPVIALAMSVLNMRIVPSARRPYIFVPHAKKMKVDMLSGRAVYSSIWDESFADALLVHWTVRNIGSPKYRFESDKIKLLEKGRSDKLSLPDFVLYRMGLKLLLYWPSRALYWIRRAPSIIKRVLLSRRGS